MAIKVRRVRNVNGSNGHLSIEVDCVFTTLGEDAVDSTAIMYKDFTKIEKKVRNNEPFTYNLTMSQANFKEMMKLWEKFKSLSPMSEETPACISNQ